MPLALAGQGCGGSPHDVMRPHWQVHLVFVTKLCSPKFHVTAARHTRHDRLFALRWQNGSKGPAHRLQGCLIWRHAKRPETRCAVTVLQRNMASP